jgi:hypothetical protein
MGENGDRFLRRPNLACQSGRLKSSQKMCPNFVLHAPGFNARMAFSQKQSFSFFLSSSYEKKLIIIFVPNFNLDGTLL